VSHRSRPPAEPARDTAAIRVYRRPHGELADDRPRQAPAQPRAAADREFDRCDRLRRRRHRGRRSTLRTCLHRAPLFIGVVFVLSALLLLVVFRSLLIPIQAVLMNLLSFGAALGVVQAIFERGWLAARSASRRANRRVRAGDRVRDRLRLSMDTRSSSSSRIHEEWQREHDASASRSRRCRRTGRVITAAATVMIAVFHFLCRRRPAALQLFGFFDGDCGVLGRIRHPEHSPTGGARANRRPQTWRFPNGLGRYLPHLAIELPARAGASIPAEPPNRSLHRN